VLLTASRLHPYRILLAFAALALLAAPACKRGKIVTQHEYMYVSAIESSLRDRVATMYNKVSTVHNGDRVEVLERVRRFVRVRTDQGAEGWIEQRSLVSQDVFDGFQKLVADSRNQAVQGHGTTRAELNMHLTPSRDGEHLYQLKEGEKVEVLRRATTDKNAPKPPQPPKPGAASKSTANAKDQKAAATTPPAAANTNPPAATPPAAPQVERTAVQPAAPSSDKSNQAEPTKPVMEDWYLVRNSAGQVGWVLMRMVDLDVPLDIAQYAEGQRIVGYFVLNTVQETIDDKPTEEPQYLVLLNQPKDGLPYDYNQVRVFTRNRNKHRYETAYREREMEGYLPVTTGHAVFDKEGDLPTFTIRKMNAEGTIVATTYKMNGPIVRRVLTPEEMADQKARKEADLASRKKARADAKAQKPPSKKKKHH
jgi:Bacterial SH3 domain/GW (Gly-Tryp) dipeptide domain